MKLTPAQRALLAELRQALPEEMPAGAFAVYTLSDPNTGAVRYVGVTQRPRARFLQHFKHPVLRGEKQRWLEQLAAQDQLPIMTIAEVFSGSLEEAQRREQEWITRLSAEGAPLLNRETWERATNRSRDDVLRAQPDTTNEEISGNKQKQKVLLPAEQFFVLLFGKPVLGVRLTDGRICLALRWLCDVLRLDSHAQLRRIKRKTALRDGLVRVRIHTNGGPQVVPVLELDMMPGWILSIDEHRVVSDLRQQVIALQHEAVQVLFNQSGLAEWQMPEPVPSEPVEPMALPRDASNAAIPTQIPMPAAPAEGASRDARKAYHRDMLAWYERIAAAEKRRKG
ncbi:MAG TPA: phage antirepressor N-terminal domain-containing protein [Ktedonobacterales bacterium]|nr:phage antirepressor N-terminal domain-containing protein [Ktedonobacterales bacterium]